MDLYKVIICVLCNHYNLKENETNNILKNKECKYLFLLLLNEYKCLNKNKLIKELRLKSTRSIDYNLRIAEEKLLINKDFRKKYFYLNQIVQKEC